LKEKNKLKRVEIPSNNRNGAASNDKGAENLKYVRIFITKRGRKIMKAFASI
jgi:hypothetical protein